jgi:hypothetical protein
MGNDIKESVPIPASPAKAFFVEMITRDIELQDAILDLLDNCVDGIRRSTRVNGAKPYDGYYAHIKLSEDEFVIEDNCGGIPLDIAKKYAFMMGRPAEFKELKSGTIGVYGIGMKRAIFKMGRSCIVHSHTKQDTFEVAIKPAWLDDDHNWNLEATEAKPVLKKHGTRIAISSLHKGIAADFAENSSFCKDFPKAISDAFSFLLEKGFEVKVNGVAIEPNVPKLLWDIDGKGDALRPYIYQAEIKGVSVFLAVGFREKPETVDDDADAEARYRSEDAGWTVVCNDRAVLSCDKSRQTGWGWGGIPSYHTQFIAISGLVLFDGHPADLPMTTTKRGVDANSDLFCIVRERMQEGVLHFTKFTNEWKGQDVSKLFKSADAFKITDIHRKAEKGDVRFNSLKGEGRQRQSLPHLPQRPKLITERRISYLKPIKEIEAVSQFLFERTDAKPKEVGEECFDFVLRKIK